MQWRCGAVVQRCCGDLGLSLTVVEVRWNDPGLDLLQVHQAVTVSVSVLAELLPLACHPVRLWTVVTVETVETVEAVETVETVETEDTVETVVTVQTVETADTVETVDKLVRQ